MATTVFDAISHADFLRLTLAAFARQGYAVEQSSAAGADGVLLARTVRGSAFSAKKYRGASSGRPVLSAILWSNDRLRCTEGYLITTTDCSPEAYDFAAGKGIVLYSQQATSELLRTAFGDELIRTGRCLNWGQRQRPSRRCSPDDQRCVIMRRLLYLT